MLSGLLACSYPLVEKESPYPNTLKSGTRFRFNLKEDHQRAETWQLVQDWEKGSFQVLGNTWHGAEKGLDINLQALKPGNYTLTAFKRRYQDTIEVKRYLLTIVAN